MTDTIKISSSDPIKGKLPSYAWPVLHKGSTNFPSAEYIIEFSREGESSITIKHEITNSEFINALLKTDKAKYACVISSPSSFYREVFISTDNCPTQILNLTPENYAEPPFFNPVVILTEPLKNLSVDDYLTDMSPLWSGVNLNIPKGAKLAIGPIFKLSGSLVKMLIFRAEPEMKNGQFEVKERTSDGFRFEVNLSQDLFDYIKYSKESKGRKNILTHVITAALSLLQRKYGGSKEGEEIDPWKLHPNLNVLYKHLELKNCLTWEQEDFSPEKVATALYQIEIEQKTEEAEND